MRQVFYFIAVVVFATFLATASHAALVATPVVDNAIRIYGYVGFELPKDSNIAEITSLIVNTSTEYDEQLDCEKLALDIYNPTTGKRIQIDTRNMKFKDNQLAWNMKQSITPEMQLGDGFIVDMNITFTKIANTDDAAIGSMFKFTTTLNDKSTVDMEQRVDYSNLIYTDTDAKFDLKYEVSVSQMATTFTPSEQMLYRPYRFSALVYDTTRWDTRAIVMGWVGPFKWDIMPANVDATGEIHNDIIPHYHNSAKKQTTCLVNSQDVEATLDTSTGQLTILLEEHFVPLRSAISIYCADIFVYSHQRVDAFNKGTESQSVITIYGNTDLKTESILDVRTTSVPLTKYHLLPQTFMGEGQIENGLGKIEIKTAFGGDLGHTIAKSGDIITTAWTKVQLKNKLHTFVQSLKPPVEGSKSRRPIWAVQTVLDTPSDNSPATYMSDTPVLRAFNPNGPNGGAPIENFWLQQWVDIASLKASITPVAFYKYRAKTRRVFDNKKVEIFAAAVPKMKVLQAVAKTINFVPSNSKFNFIMKDLLTEVKQMEFVYPRNFYQFNGDKNKPCTVTIQQEQAKLEYKIVPQPTPTNPMKLSGITLEFPEDVMAKIGNGINVYCPALEPGYKQSHPHYPKEWLTLRVNTNNEHSNVDLHQTSIGFTTPEYKFVIMAATCIALALGALVLLLVFGSPLIVCCTWLCSSNDEDDHNTMSSLPQPTSNDKKHKDSMKQPLLSDVA